MIFCTTWFPLLHITNLQMLPFTSAKSAWIRSASGAVFSITFCIMRVACGSMLRDRTLPRRLFAISPSLAGKPADNSTSFIIIAVRFGSAQFAGKSASKLAKVLSKKGWSFSRRWTEDFGSEEPGAYSWGEFPEYRA